MISWRAGRVTALGRAWRGARELTADVGGTSIKALAYPLLTGEPEVGDRVLLNTTTLAMGLGTGGYAMVVALPDRLPEDHLKYLATWSKRVTRRCKPSCSARKSRVPHTTNFCATPIHSAGCRW